MPIPTLADFATTIRALTPAELDGAPSLFDRLRIAADRDVEVCYAPFEHVNPSARVVIVGITPGRTQMLNALREARRQLDRGTDPAAAAQAAKQVGAFSGAMRPNLVGLLDGIGLNRWLGLPSCDALFGSAAQLVQATSALRNPVFVRGENYSGNPNMIRHPLLRSMLRTGFGEDARRLAHAVFVPLGDKVAEALQFLAAEGCIARERILDGLPHPSGANAERVAYFLGRKPRDRLSAKTDPLKLDAARAALCARVAGLPAG